MNIIIDIMHYILFEMSIVLDSENENTVIYVQTNIITQTTFHQIYFKHYKLE